MSDAVSPDEPMMDDHLGDLYRRYGPVIYSRCLRLLGDHAAAEDATHETFLRVHRHLDKAPGAREALAWIYRIATNYCLNEIRDRRRRPMPLDPLPDLGGGDDVDFTDRELVARIVQRSPPSTRAVAWLYHVDGLEQCEVAEVLGISRRTVVNRLSDFSTNARKFIARTGS